MKKKYSKDSRKVIQIDDTGTCADFPGASGRRIRKNKASEPYHVEEIGRRTKVIGALPAGKSSCCPLLE